MCACVHTKSLQSCPTLCNPMDCSPPGSSVHGILQKKKTGVGCHALVHGIFQTLGLNPCLLCLLQWQAGSLPLVPSSKTDFCTFLFFLFFLCLCKVKIWLPYSPIVRVVVRELYLWWPLQIWEEVNLLIYPSFILLSDPGISKIYQWHWPPWSHLPGCCEIITWVNLPSK